MSENCRENDVARFLDFGAIFEPKMVVTFLPQRKLHKNAVDLMQTEDFCKETRIRGILSA